MNANAVVAALSPALKAKTPASSNYLKLLESGCQHVAAGGAERLFRQQGELVKMASPGSRVKLLY